MFSPIVQVSKDAFNHTMEEMNRMYAQAESLSARTYCESCFACLTAYLSYICIDTYYEKVRIGMMNAALGLALLKGLYF